MNIHKNHIISLLLLTLSLMTHGAPTLASNAPDLVVHNARVTSFTQDAVTAFAVKDGRFTKLSADNKPILADVGPETTIIDAGGRRVIPGLNDSHLHVVRGGRFYNLETRWEGLSSLDQAIDLIREQASRTPSGQWVRVIGGWSPYQFVEQRMPTVEELNEAAPDTPVFILHLYSGGLLNRAGLQALGIDKATRAPAGSRFERDQNGEPTGILIAEPNPMILYRTIAALPQLTREQQLNSTHQFYRELLSLGITSAIDAGGGGHVFPSDYAASTQLAISGELPLRISNYLFPQSPGDEFSDFAYWMQNYQQNQNLDAIKTNGYVIEGGGELLVWSASDYENFRAERPELEPGFETDLEKVIRLHLLQKWPFRIHATYNETITRMLNVLESINAKQPLNRVRWAFDHAETISDENLRRVKRLGGAIAIQGRMAFAGEDFLKRYGEGSTSRTPPIRRMLDLGIPVSLGTDGTRVSSYNPWPTYYWAVSGKTVGGTTIYDDDNRLSRVEALQLFTRGSAWLTGEELEKGDIAVDYYADFAILSQDVLSIDERELLETRSDLTVVNGKIEYSSEAFPKHAKPLLPATPDWSPVNYR